MTETEEPTTLPALFHHIVKAYDTMLEQAEELVTDEPKGTVVVYKGFITRLITHELSLSAPYYTKVMGALEGMGCVAQIRRGGNTTPSEWQLITEPKEEEFRRYLDKSGLNSKPQGRAEMHQDQIINLTRRVGVLEHTLEQLVSGLQREQEEEKAHG
jgi:hypothetical protein